MLPPMLAAKADPIKDLEKLAYPRLVSPKLDGIRALSDRGALLSRSLKMIPNVATQEFFGTTRLHGLDGELIVGDSVDPLVFNKTSSGVMSIDGDPQARLFVFDAWAFGSEPYSARCKLAVHVCKDLPKKLRERIIVVEQTLVHSPAALLGAEEHYLDLGYEGIMSRTIDGKYKHGRATLKQGWLVKHKRFEDGEARVLEMYPLMHNTNEATTNELGRTKRSSAKAGKVAYDTLGRMLVEDVKSGVRFELGRGTMTAAEAKAIWDAWEADPIGMRATLIAKYAHFPYGAKDKPRLPVFKGWRSPLDL